MISKQFSFSSIVFLGFSLQAATFAGVSDQGMSPFSFEIFKQMSGSESGSKNEIFSAASIHSALGMAYFGTSPHSSTASEFQKVLGLSPSSSVSEIAEGYADWAQDLHGKAGDEGSPVIEVANQVLLSQALNVNPKYVDLLKKMGSEIKIEDFKKNSGQILSAVNEWVSDRTHGKISNILTRIRPDERMLILNAIYFKAAWRNKFRQATESFFYPSAEAAHEEKEGSPALMMSQTERVRYYSDHRLQAVEIPYRGPKLSDSGLARYSFYALLPQDSSVTQMIENMDFNQFSEIQEHMLLRNGKIHLPKFKVEAKYELSEILPKLGLSTALGNHADFRQLSSEELSISRIIHKAFIEVDEKGTEAAAATAIGMRANSMSPITFEFNANHPFVYLILDNERNTVLFQGVLRNPGE